MVEAVFFREVGVFVGVDVLFQWKGTLSVGSTRAQGAPRFEDFVSHRKEVRIVPRRDNANGARAKTLEEQTIPISSGLVRLYNGYMFEEYGDCDSDYVFVNLFAQPYGRPLTYQGVHQLVRRLRARTGIWFTLHMLRHSRATNLLRNGVGVDVVARLLTHRSSTTTSQTYVHLNVDDLRAELTRSGAWGKEDQS